MMVSKKLENALSSRLVRMSPLQQSLAGSHLMLPLLCTHQVPIRYFLISVFVIHLLHH